MSKLAGIINTSMNDPNRDDGAGESEAKHKSPLLASPKDHNNRNRGQTPSGIPRHLDYGFPRTMSHPSSLKDLQRGFSGDTEHYNPDNNDEDESNDRDPERINFSRTNSEFRGGFDIDDPEQREKVCIRAVIF